MEKKQYIIPTFEVSPMQAAIGIMKTSIMTTPSEPGAAPKRNPEVF